MGEARGGTPRIFAGSADFGALDLWEVSGKPADSAAAAGFIVPDVALSLRGGFKGV